MSLYFYLFIPLVNISYGLLDLMAFASALSWTCNIPSAGVIAIILVTTTLFWLIVALVAIYRKIHLKGMPLMCGVLGAGFTVIAMLTYVYLSFLKVSTAHCVVRAICSSLAIIGVSGLICTVGMGLLLLFISRGQIDFCGNSVPSDWRHCEYTPLMI